MLSHLLLSLFKFTKLVPCDQFHSQISLILSRGSKTLMTRTFEDKQLTTQINFLFRTRSHLGVCGIQQSVVLINCRNQLCGARWAIFSTTTGVVELIKWRVSLASHVLLKHIKMINFHLLAVFYTGRGTFFPRADARRRESAQTQ